MVKIMITRKQYAKVKELEQKRFDLHMLMGHLENKIIPTQVGVFGVNCGSINFDRDHNESIRAHLNDYSKRAHKDLIEEVKRAFEETEKEISEYILESE